METTVTRIPTSFRFQSTLLDELKSKAKASNRSLNNYVESLLISILHPKSGGENVITEELQQTINKVLDEHKNGEFVRCRNNQELQSYLESL